LYQPETYVITLSFMVASMQGMDGRIYPWGDTWQADAVPVPSQPQSFEAQRDFGQQVLRKFGVIP
jgi:hypothetical protein